MPKNRKSYEHFAFLPKKSLRTRPAKSLVPDEHEELEEKTTIHRGPNRKQVGASTTISRASYTCIRSARCRTMHFGYGDAQRNSSTYSFQVEQIRLKMYHSGERS